MEKPVLFYTIASLAALISFGIGLLYCVARWKKQRLRKNLFWLTVSLLLAVLFTEAAMVAMRVEDFSWRTLLVSTFQAFTLDSGYGALTNAPAVYGALPDGILSAVRVLIYSLAPLAGGAIVLDILADAFPSLRMYFYRLRPMLVFSELNQKSLLLAESISRQSEREGKRKPLVVFTDCYVNVHGEEESELLLHTRRLHCVCLEDDILHSQAFAKSRACSFFLMDDRPDGDFDDESNLATLCGLLKSEPEERGEPRAWSRKHGCRIFIFSNNTEGMENIRCVKKAFDEERTKREEELEQSGRRDDTGEVRVHLIRDYALASCVHLNDAPLFGTLADAPAGEPLHVAILGDSPFAGEMFKTVFWCGQLLDHPLKLSVVYRPDTPGEYAARLDRLSPEIRRSCVPGDDCLRINRFSEEYAEPYAQLQFVETDPGQADLRALLKRELKGVDRFIVMQRGDSANIGLADELRRSLIYLYRDKTLRRRPVISYLVENDDLLEVAGKRFADDDGRDDGFFEPEMIPFGSLKERFDWRNVYMDGEYLAARSQQTLNEEHGVRDISSSRDDLYNDWSRVARSFHQQYKMFSAGCDMRGDEVTRSLQFMDIVRGDETVRTRLRWLEQRRWCAFLRAEGFSCPPRMADAIEAVRGEAWKAEDWRSFWRYGLKDVVSRLHPCLLECYDADQMRRYDPNEQPDLLDEMDSIRKLVKTGEDQERKKEKKKEPKPTPPEVAAYYERRDGGLRAIKRYDLPDGDYSPRLSREELWYLLRGEKTEKLTETQWAQLTSQYEKLRQCAVSGAETQFYLDRLILYYDAEIKLPRTAVAEKA